MAEIEKYLERFVINNTELEELEGKLSEFNLFETLGVQLFEIRHSNALAFLFYPGASHGLADYFLKKFLIHTLAQADPCPISPITVDCWDLTDGTVRREYQEIDLLIISRSNKFVCCIENKVLANESNDQLAKYKSIIESEFPDFKYRLFIFLSPMGVESSDTDNWLVSTYEVVADVLKIIVEMKLKDVGSQQAFFISHYHDIVRRYLLENSDEAQLAREIYNKHKVALDFIFKNISDSRQYLFDETKKILEDPKNDFVPLYSTLSRIRFTTKILNELLPKCGDGRWNQMNHVFAYEIINNSDSVSLVLIMGPADQSYRGKVLDVLKPIFLPKYLKYKASLSEMYNTIYRRPIITKDEYSLVDRDEKVSRIQKLLDRSSNSDFSDIERFFVAEVKGIGET